MKFVQQQFFPPSARSELVVDLTLPQNASIAATKAAMDRFERHLVGNNDVAIGPPMSGTARFVSCSLSTCRCPARTSGNLIVAKDVKARDRLRTHSRRWRKRNSSASTFKWNYCMGPPAGRAVQYRVSGTDVPKVKELAQQLAAKMAPTHA